MGALAQVVSWIPEDDLLLKNAIEAGASLESLAKGAVQFSRRFSIKELQDRWHALLYDPVVSTEAALRMAELERTNPNFPTKFTKTGSKENKSSSNKKRRAEQLRSTYHSLRKKFRTESFNSLDLGFLVPSNDGSHFMDNGDGTTHLGLEDSHMDIIHNAFPDILADGGGGCVTTNQDNLQGYVGGGGENNLTFAEHGCEGSKEKLEVSSAHEQQPKTAMASTDCFLAQLSTSLFEDEEPFMGKEVDKSYYDGLSSLLGNTANVKNSVGALPITSAGQALPVDTVPNGHVMIPEVYGTGAVGSMECKPVPDLSSFDPHPEVVNGVICCLLNQEDPDIPCNDDIFVSNTCHPMSVSSLARRNFKDISNPVTSSVRDLSASRERGEGQKKTAGRLQGSSSQGKTEMGQPSQSTKFRGLTSAEPHNKVGPPQACSNTLLSDGGGAKDGNNKEVGSGKRIVGFDEHGSYSEKDSGNCKEEEGVVPMDEAPQAKDDDDVDLIEILERELEMTTNAEEADGQVFESDEEDLPNYSDIEAMILDMDLDPDDQDNFDLEVSKYQSQEMKRTIMRLEQAAYSYMQRAIASRGAFAVLYGRYSKHYIKKPEVLVGRSTEDLSVDIDLGREKRGSKISRRQAIIRLGDDGSFHMKNLGKYAISVNEKEVDPGQSIILKSDCLLEIRGMPFIFETNQKRMKEYLKRIGKGN
ncbi:Forkhead-associated [Hirschfeldia incana]|nr:Forkhead-associated [Hirschfeldia incana]KAJ0255337.1 Forkhead-associated [Hirschfeldia incana]